MHRVVVQMSSKRKSQKPKLVSSLIKPRGRCSGMWFIIYIFCSSYRHGTDSWYHFCGFRQTNVNRPVFHRQHTQYKPRRTVLRFKTNIVDSVSNLSRPRALTISFYRPFLPIVSPSALQNRIPQPIQIRPTRKW